MKHPTSETCPFCHRIARGEVTVQNDLAAAFPDGFPISPGHTLIVPKRHEAEFFDLTDDEHSAIMDLTRRLRRDLADSTNATAFNIGVNGGPDAGQTIAHAHLHLIPRYRGDMADPRGGVRWIIPDKAAYWTD